jgi:hypothetical protein
VPSGAKLRICISDETANVSTGKRNTHDVHVHDTKNRDLHILFQSVVVSKPHRAVLAHACKRASGNDHGTLTLVLKPLRAGSNLKRAEQRVSIELSEAVRVVSIKRDGLVLKRFTSGGIWELETDRVANKLIAMAHTVAEVGSFVHILPETIEGNLTLE